MELLDSILLVALVLLIFTSIAIFIVLIFEYYHDRYEYKIFKKRFKNDEQS